MSNGQRFGYDDGTDPGRFEGFKHKGYKVPGPGGQAVDPWTGNKESYKYDFSTACAIPIICTILGVCGSLAFLVM